LEAKTNYTAVGIAVITLSALLISFALWLSVGFNQKKYNTYLVYIYEAVSGLTEESPVKFNGVQVGFVDRIELNEQDPRQVMLYLNIEDGTPITTSTSATLISLGITGTSYVGLSAASSVITPLKVIPGERYPIIPSKPSLFNQFDQAIRDVSENVNKVSVEIRKIFDAENAERFKKTLANVETISDVIAENNKRINESMKNADELLKQLSKASADFPEVVTQLKSDLTALHTLLRSANVTSQQITETMASGKIAVDKFSNQTLPPAITLIKRLDSIATNLDKVSKEMRQNPAVVIRGTTPAKKGPGE